MTDLLDDIKNLILLKNIVSGKAVGVNLTTLSKILSRHRSTIKKKVEKIFDHGIINRPTFPFLALFKLCPLLVVLRIDLPENEEFVRWVKEDPHIFAAFRSRQGEYNTLIFVYHENITKYQLWMDSLPSILRLNYGISDVEPTFLSDTSYFSNQLMIKYRPSSGINLLERDIKEKGELIINQQRLDYLDFEIMNNLVSGKGMKVNLALLCDESGLHRKTVEKRINALVREGLIYNPVCRFPNFFVPPNYVLTFSLFEVKKSREKVIREIAKDYHVPIALKIMHGRYNLLLFGNHSSISDHLRWEEKYRRRFPDSFGRANITYLSPEMTISFDPKIVSLCLIEDRLNHLRGRELRKPLQTI